MSASAEHFGEFFETSINGKIVRVKTKARGQQVKTLIFNGSPRVEGDTVSLIKQIAEFFDQ